MNLTSLGVRYLTFMVVVQIIRLVPGLKGGSRPSRDIAGDYGWRRVGKAAEAFRRWHGVYSALPSRLAPGPIGGPTLA